MHLKLSSVHFVCCIYTVLLKVLTDVSVDANSVAQDGSTVFAQEAFKTVQQTTKVVDLCCDLAL